MKQVAENNPVAAVTFLKDAHHKGHLLNDYVFGGYLIWSDPGDQVFMDGRADVYEWAGVFAQMVRWEPLQEDPSLLLDRFAIETCLLARTSPMVQVLRLLQGWHVIYEDPQAVIFRRLGPVPSQPPALPAR